MEAVDLGASPGSRQVDHAASRSLSDLGPVAGGLTLKSKPQRCTASPLTIAPHSWLLILSFAYKTGLTHRHFLAPPSPQQPTLISLLIANMVTFLLPHSHTLEIVECPKCPTVVRSLRCPSLAAGAYWSRSFIPRRNPRGSPSTEPHPSLPNGSVRGQTPEGKSTESYVTLTPLSPPRLSLTAVPFCWFPETCTPQFMV